MQWKKKFTRLKAATGHSRARRMLCCGRRKVSGRKSIFSLTKFAFDRTIPPLTVFVLLLNLCPINRIKIISCSHF